MGTVCSTAEPPPQSETVIEIMASPSNSPLLLPLSQPQLKVKREVSAPFFFQHAFVKDNLGNMRDAYTVSSELGAGAFGTVYLAECKELGAKRAIKSIPMLKVKNPERFKAEISIARDLDHPNIVRLYETFREEHHIYLVMEICTGGELFERIMKCAKEGFDEGQGTSYIRQILAACTYLHANSFAHRDVKPENFLFDTPAENAALKLIDFGLARRFEKGVPMATKGGTPYYVAPEIFTAKYDERVDVWSAGVVAYILLCGYPPFNGNSDKEVVRRVRRGTFKFLSPDWDHVSTELKRLVADLLTLSPSMRPSAAKALDTLASISSSQNASRKTAAAAAADNIGFLQKLQVFHAHTKLKRVGLTAAVQQIPDSELKSLREAFKRLDVDGDGRLSPQEVYTALESQGCDLHLDPAFLEEVLQSVDSNGSGSMDYTEFLAATVEQKLVANRDVCKAAFRTFDLDGDGRITADELERVLGSPCDPAKSPGTGRVAKMVSDADKDGDGAIDFEEFYAFMSSPTPCRRDARFCSPSATDARCDGSVDRDTLMAPRKLEDSYGNSDDQRASLEGASTWVEPSGSTKNTRFGSL